jgi:ATP/maltotriose-dependent transcriptional regulator MalT
MAALARAGVAVATGSLDRALEAAETAARLAVGHAPSAAPWSAAMLACAQRERGELSAAARALTPLDTLVSDDMATAVAAETRAELHLARGHPRRAWDDALLAGTALGRCGAADYPLLPWRLTAAAAGVRSDKGERAAELAREELALARRAGAPRWIGRALVAISELPGEDEIARLEEAVATLADSHADLDRAVAAFRLGRALGHARRGPDAEASFGEALDLAERCGARQLAKDVRHALRDLGVKPRRRPEHGPAAMTGAEWRVARLAARHLTNREIATELHLTVSTVEYHLTRAFRKLEVESREGLAAALDGLDEGDR